MENYIIIAISALFSFLLGMFFIFVVLKISSSNSNKKYFIKEIDDFKNSLEEFKKQTQINSFETKNAIAVASKLTSILTTNQNLKGQFGQDCLEYVLKACFNGENIDYIKQPTFSNAAGDKIRPDYLVCLPNNKAILIDCKLNLEKYMEFKDNFETELKNLKKAEFIKDLNNTVNNLANKRYETALEIETVDFILMYIPIEPVITLIYTDSDFLSVVKNATEKNIVLVGNSSVLTVIRLVKLLWAKEIQDKNIENIVETASRLYESIARHSNELFEMKENLNNLAVKFNKEYEKMAVNSNFFKTAQKLHSYGIDLKTKKYGKKLSEIEINSEFLS